MEEMKNGYCTVGGKPEGKSHWGELGVDVRIILESMLGE
jgi:hypothetical protein